LLKQAKKIVNTRMTDLSNKIKYYEYKVTSRRERLRLEVEQRKLLKN